MAGPRLPAGSIERGGQVYVPLEAYVNAAAAAGRHAAEPGAVPSKRVIPVNTRDMRDVIAWMATLRCED